MVESRKLRKLHYLQSTKILNELINNLMFQLNISGIEAGMKELAKQIN